MIAALIAITNAALSSVWAEGVGVVRVEYDLCPTALVSTARAAVPFAEDGTTGVASLPPYGRSGYDRGHLAPAADFASQPSRLPFTYRSSNIAPMAAKFNRGEWARVERAVREKVKRLGETARVVTIPVYGGTNRLGAVAIPTAFLKVVYTNGVAVAAWLKYQDGAEK